MNALVISASLPPFNDSSTMQLLGRFREADRFDIVPLFIGAEMPDGVESPAIGRLPRNAQIHRTAPPLYDRIRAALQAKRFTHRLHWLFVNYASRMWFPDVRRGWDRLVIRESNRRWPELRPDVLISSGGSVMAHIAASALADQHGLKWIADYGDPWSPIERGGILGMFRRERAKRLEKRILTNASGLVFSTAETQQLYARWLGSSMPRSIAMPCYGYNEQDFAPNRFVGGGSALAIHLAHIGAAHRSDRSLLPLLSAVKCIERESVTCCDFSISIVGNHSREFETYAARNRIKRVSFAGRVSFAESLRAYYRADVAVMVGNKGPLQVPGKLYHVLGTPIPIFYIAQASAVGDPCWSILKSMAGVVRADNTCESILLALRYIKHHYSDLKQAAQLRRKSALADSFTERAISDRFLAFVRNVTAHA